MNKKAEKLMVFWWFFAVIFVFIVIVFTAVNFFAKPVDVRELQSQVVFSKLYSCLTVNSYLKPEVFQENFNIVEFCKLRDSKSMQDSQFFIYINFTDKDTGKSLLASPIKAGDGSLKLDCEVASKKTAKSFPSCLIKENIFPIYYLSGNERRVAFFNILVASQYYGERVSTIKPLGLKAGAENE